MKNKKESVVAPVGEKMIEVNIKFWTNDIAYSPGKIVPKHAWGSGMVVMPRNKAHGIDSGKYVPFHSLMQLPAAIEKLLIQSNVKIETSRTMRKYVQG